ncbi:MAG: UDP-N-acetylmuramoyl-L-alanyl-D-glutamate--2,6-diaminopimelate ligase [Ruminococcaceae bacterium]|nr:UDP-N-acetylmuramoyl-L-alanyl-D-glutamate--2,6-diaminopimelate ligase [Oscillospiraceae bacterium]
MKVSELFGKSNIDYPREAENIEITEIVTDSRKACEGCAFICINGQRHDGHENIGEAVSVGAKVIVAEQVRDEGVGGAAAIYVENTRRAAALLYNTWYNNPAEGMKLVAVTGTNGKTSVSFLLKKIFERAGYRCGVIGTVGCISCGRLIHSYSENPNVSMTTPDPEDLYRILSLMRDDGVEYVFIEATSHALALSKLDALSFDIGIFTNLTQDHLDFHGSMENYFKAKSRLFEMCDKAIINIDDLWAQRFIERAHCKDIYTVSAKAEADVIAKNIIFSRDHSTSYMLRSRFGDASVKLGVPGRFFVVNSLEAAAAALVSGIDAADIAGALADFGGVDGRMERVRLDEDARISVFVDYAHTPDALENLLKSVRDIRDPRQRIVLLFGCGGDRDRGKRKEMAQIASRLSDFVIVTSDNSRSEDPERIISDILKGIDKEKEFVVIEERASAIEYAVCNSRRGDIIILAGKGHERYEIDRDGKHPFDERDIVKKAYEKFKRIYKDN